MLSPCFIIIISVFSITLLLACLQAAVQQQEAEFMQLYQEKVQYMRRTAAAEVRYRRRPFDPLSLCGCARGFRVVF